MFARDSLAIPLNSVLLLVVAAAVVSSGKMCPTKNKPKGLQTVLSSIVQI
jgi:hypothetical protein